MNDVSIVIPCYNRSHLVRGAIDSALGEDGAGEIIVVDDGSTDDSWDRISAYGDAIVKLRIENSGPAIARNVGVANATGRWIKFLDSDDLLISGSVSSQLGQASRLPERSLPVGQLVSDNDPAPPTRSEKGLEISKRLLGRDVIQTSRPLIERSAFESVGGFRKGTAHEDYELFLRLAMRGYRFFEFPTPVVLFRDVDPNRLSREISETRFLEIFNVYARLEDELRALEVDGVHDLRLGIGTSAWSIARRCTRNGFHDLASDMFSLAERVAGRAGRSASLPLRVMYMVFDPVRTEKLATSFKKILGASNSR